MSFSYEKNKTKNSYKYKEIMNAINNFGIPTQEYKNHQFLNSTMTNQRNSNAYSPLNYKTISTLRPNNNYQTYKSKSKNIFGLKLDLTNKNKEKFVLTKKNTRNKREFLGDIYNYELLKFEGMLKRGKKFQPTKTVKKIKEVKFKPDNEKLDEEKKKCLRKLNYWDYL